MKLLSLFALLCWSVCVSAQLEKVIPKRPSPPRLVNDFTGTLTPEQVQALESKMVAYDDSTSNQVAIVIINNLGGYDVEEVGLGIIRNWGVGNKDKNNGIVLLVSKEEKKIRIEVGYGLEGAVPDITAKSIIDNDLRPNFKEGNYYRGIDKATDDIIKAAAGEYKAPEGYGAKKTRFPLGSIIFFLIIISIIIAGSSRGGGSGGMMSPTGWIIGSMLGRSGGGWSGGGGGWSGGGGGGGFGGFGGGGGGGGGASGGW